MYRKPHLEGKLSPENKMDYAPGDNETQSPEMSGEKKQSRRILHNGGDRVGRLFASSGPPGEGGGGCCAVHAQTYKQKRPQQRRFLSACEREICGIT